MIRLATGWLLLSIGAVVLVAAAPMIAAAIGMVLLGLALMAYRKAP